MRNLIFKFFLFVFVLSFFMLSTSFVFAKSVESFIPEKPAYGVYFVDDANLFSETTKFKLSLDSNYLEEKYNTQFFVVTVNSLHNISIEEYADKLFSNWTEDFWTIDDKSKKESSKVLLLISKEEHKAIIKTSANLNEKIPVDKKNEILNMMFADFNKNNYDSGIKHAYNMLNDELIGEKTVTISLGQEIIAITLFLFVLFVVLNTKISHAE